MMLACSTMVVESHIQPTGPGILGLRRILARKLGICILTPQGEKATIGWWAGMKDKFLEKEAARWNEDTTTQEQEESKECIKLESTEVIRSHVDQA